MRYFVQARQCLSVGLAFLFSSFAYGFEVPNYPFSLQPYSQVVSDYISPEHPQYSQGLVSDEKQTQQFQGFYRHFFASDEKGLSPWSEGFVVRLIPTVLSQEVEILNSFDNKNNDMRYQHHGVNLKPHPPSWITKIKSKMNLPAFDSIYHAEQRAILTQNTHARSLPEDTPDFYHASFAGEGYPFDNLQLSALYAGTPIYVLHLSAGKDWALVLTPHAFMGWIKTSDFAYASSAFVQSWQVLAKNGLMAITETEANLQDVQSRFQLTSYIGAVFPLSKEAGSNTEVYVPVRNEQGRAKLKQVLISSQAVTRMPFKLSAAHVADLIKSLQHRPYGWGGVNFYNDCSAEMQHLFTPFGIWLPRNSAQQANLPSAVDLSFLPMEDRINSLKAQGKPLLTLIYIGGHVVLYTGVQTKGDFAGEPMTYQNVWGLAPPGRDKRYLIGESVFLPLLKHFSQQPDIESQASHTFFKLVFLDQISDENSAESFMKRFF